MSILPNGYVPSNLVDYADEKKAGRVGKSPAFDFKAGEFTRSATGRVAEVKEMESLRLWILKALFTPRGVYKVYSEDFGNEAFTLLGADLPDSILFMEVERLCREALIYDPRIKDVSQFRFDREADKVYVSFLVLAQDGESDIKFGIEVR